MLTVLVVVFPSLALICCGHRAVAFENVALRQQLAVFRRTVKRPQFRNGDRLFWVLFSKAWQDWRTALVVVHPDTVVRWHRQWLRRRWTQRSAHARPVARARLRPFERSLARWAPRIRCGERLGFMEN
jgi:putative transposase